MQWEFEWLYALQDILIAVLDKLLGWLSVAGDAGILWITLGVVLLIFPKYRKIGIQTLIAIVVTFVVGNLILKNLFERERPSWIDPNIELLIKNPTDFSFPSGHSMNGFTAAVAILYNDRKLGIPAILLAAVIAFSRLYNFVHFPTDIFAGALIGSVIAIIVCYVFHKVDAGHQKKKLHKK